MSRAEKAGRTAIKLTNGVVNIFVLVAILLLLAFSSYAIWDSNQVFNVADATNYAIFRPSEEDGGASFEELQAINPDVFAWLTVYGTGIDYPVVQGEDNMYYVSRDARGNHSMAGSIFLDNRSCRDFTDFSSIFYGHHMARGVMFGDIEHFADRRYFDGRQYGMLYFNGREHGLEFFAFVHTHASDGEVFRTNIMEREQQQAYLDMLIDMAINTRDVPVTIDDRIVLLSTCSNASTNGRDILIGRITDETFDDPFWTEDPDRTNTIPIIDRLPDLWAQAPLWGKIGIIALPCLSAVMLVVLIYTKRAKKKRNTHNKGE
ncbi:MAG: class B sortase [Oscillospiraceae bacterium]|nr:class B sortase [Oscillospiraceae bacterium]